MTDHARFDLDTLAWLRDAREVRIETEAADGTRHRAIIWPVVDGSDRIFVRSYRGARGRWYREAISGRPVRLLGDGRAAGVTVESAGDKDRITACSAELERKYADSPSTPAMVREDVLETTLELHPR